MQDILIGNRHIGPNHPPMIVAELSGNHNHSLDRALKLIQIAKDCGVHAIKIQTYTPDTITLDIRKNEFLITDPKSLWYNRNLYELAKEAHLPWEWHAQIFEKCRQLNLIAFSTPFDETAVDFLETFNPPCYKIASPEIVDLDLIRKTAATKRPLIISTAAATLAEISEAVAAAKDAGCRDLILLKCTAAYPAPPEDVNLRTIPHLSQCFDTVVGLSDHTLGIGVAIASVAQGASLIEKHFTLDRAEGGVDSAFSMNPEEMRDLVIESEKAWKSLGSIRYAATPAERVTHSHRPSLYFIEDLPKGTKISSKHIRSVRPSNGLPPKELPHILGLTLKSPVTKGTAISWDLFKE